MAENKFKVYGQDPKTNTNLYPTSENSGEQTAEQDAYDNLFKSGVKPNTIARSQDVLTPLRELTIFSVSFFNWLKDQGLDNTISDFEDSIVVDNDEEATVENLEATLTNIYNALTQAITNKINAKEKIITKPQSQTSQTGSILRGIVDSNSIFSWSWDSTVYQVASSILNQIDSYFTNNSKSGFLYKKLGSSTSGTEVKSTNLPFVYFKEEVSDSSGNKILNLATFKYTE